MIILLLIASWWISGTASCSVPPRCENISVIAPDFPAIEGYWRLSHDYRPAGQSLHTKEGGDLYTGTTLGMLRSSTDPDKRDDEESMAWVIGVLSLTDDDEVEILDVMCIGTSSAYENCGQQQTGSSWQCDADGDGSFSREEGPSDVTCVSSTTQGTNCSATGQHELLSVSYTPLRDLGGVYRRSNPEESNSLKARWHTRDNGEDKEPTQAIYHDGQRWNVRNTTSRSTCFSTTDNTPSDPTLVPLHEWQCKTSDHEISRNPDGWTGVRCFELDMQLKGEMSVLAEALQDDSEDDDSSEDESRVELSKTGVIVVVIVAAIIILCLLACLFNCLGFFVPCC